MHCTLQMPVQALEGTVEGMEGMEVVDLAEWLVGNFSNLSMAMEEMPDCSLCHNITTDNCYHTGAHSPLHPDARLYWFLQY